MDEGAIGGEDRGGSRILRDSGERRRGWRGEEEGGGAGCQRERGRGLRSVGRGLGFSGDGARRGLARWRGWAGRFGRAAPGWAGWPGPLAGPPRRWLGRLAWLAPGVSFSLFFE